MSIVALVGIVSSTESDALRTLAAGRRRRLANASPSFANQSLADYDEMPGKCGNLDWR